MNNLAQKDKTEANTSLYNLPRLDIFKKKKKPEIIKKSKFRYVILLSFIIAILSLMSGFVGSYIHTNFFISEKKDLGFDFKIFNPIEKTLEKETVQEYIPQTSEEEKIIGVVKEFSPSVVSISIFKNKTYYISDSGFVFDFNVGGTKREIRREEIVEGTGFIISSDGMILTNKHVVAEEDIEIEISTTEGKNFSAKILAEDPLQDLAVLKISDETWDNEIKPLALGDSSLIQSGQTVIAIGNALGEFQNTVSVGVVSGLNRNIISASNGVADIIEDVIQTDAAINLGNSGGPLLNLEGKVIGINTAISQSGQNIGFAIPINKAKKAIEQVKTLGEIIYPFLGVRYVMIDEQFVKDNNIPVNYGAILIPDKEGNPAIFPGSGASKAGLQTGDIILEMGGAKIDLKDPLAKIINNYNPEDEVELKVMRGGSIMRFSVILGKREN